jgi:hypothetical protein
MTFVVNNREYRKPRRTKTWIAIAIGALTAAALISYRAFL